MSTTIDERVVEMRFDNDQFESNVHESMSTLAKLKQSLNLTGASKGLEAVNTAAKRVTFTPILAGADAIQTKFSYMQATIQHQINRLVDSTITAGKRITSALTIDPIKSGFQEYETQINSVQTILANTQSKGTTLNDVNSALDTLNKYADKTIYNFTEMTRNIGTFTAAGVDLDTSVNAIQGIANLAAVSGSTSQQASTAMYQLSQALASGTVKLMDWNSVVNAGMGGQVFQDALKETARVHGIAIDDMIKKNGSFRETLQEGWLSSEILTETLQKFTLTTEGLTDEQIRANREMLKSKGYTEAQIDEIFKLGEMATNAATKVKTFTQLFDTLKEAAQSGWTQTWETIVGDFEESKELMTNISDVIGGFINASAEARNNLLSESLDSNWEKLIKEINAAGIETNVFEEKARAAMEAHGLDVDKLIEEHGSLSEVFKSGAVSSDILQEAVNKLKGKLVDLSKIQRELKKGHTGEDVKAAQEALKNMGYDLGKAGTDGKFGAMTEKAVKAFQELNGLEVTGIIDDKTLEALEKASESSAKLSENCDKLISKITELGGREKIIESLKNVFKYLGDVVKPVKEAFREIFPRVEASQIINVIDSFHNFTKTLKLSGDQAAKIKSTFKGLFSFIDIGVELFKQLARGAFGIISNFAGIGDSVLSATSSFGDWVSKIRDSIKETDIFGTAVDKIVGFVTTVVDKLKEFKSSADEAFEGSKLKGFLGFFENLWSFVSTIGSKIGEIGSSIMSSIAETAGDPNTWNVLTTGLFAGIFAGIARFANKLPQIVGAVCDTVDTVTLVLDDVRGCFEAYQNQLKAGTLMKIATAIGILAAAIFVLSTIKPDALDHSLGAITILFGELMGSFAIFGKLSGDMKGVFKTSTLMTSIATSLVILAVALKILSTIELKEMGVALLGMVVGLASLVGAVNLLPKQNVIKAAKAIQKMSTALVVFAIALKIMGSMSWNELAIGLVATVVGLGALVGAVRLLPKDMARRTLGIVGLATALVIMGAALKIMGSMSWEEVGRGLTALVVSMFALAGAMHLMPKNLLFMGAGLLAVASALVIMGAALKLMSSMSWEEVGRGLAVMAGSLIILSVALLVMKRAVAGAFALIIAAGALAIIAPVLKILGGMSWESIGKGLIALAGAFAVVGIAGLLLGPLVPVILSLAGAFTLFGLATFAIGAGLVLVGVGFTALATAGTAGATAIVAALTVIIMGIANLIPQLISKLGEVILAICEVIITCAPRIAETVLVVVAEILKALETYAPQILDSLLGLLIGLLRSLADHLPELIQVAMEVIGTFFQGIVDALSGVDTETIFKGIIGAGLLAGLMFALSAVVGLIPGAMAGVLGMGVVIAELAIVLAAIGALAQIPGLSWLVEEGGNLLEGIGTAIGKFIGGIVGGIASGVTSSLPDIGTNLSSFMTNLQPFMDGAKQLDASILDNVKTLVGIILALTAANVIDSVTSWITGGGSSLEKFASQIVPFGEAMVSFSQTVSGKIDAGAVTSAALAGKLLVSLMDSLPKSGGFLQSVIGEKDLQNFATQCISFAAAMIRISNALSSEKGRINVAAIEDATKAGQLFSALQNSIPKTGGMWQNVAGVQDLQTFGDSCVAFGKAMVEFSDELAGKVINVDAAQQATAAGTIFLELQKALPKTGGLWQKVAGAEDIGTFGSSVKAFAEAMSSFATENKVDEAAVTAANNAGNMMIALQNAIPESKWFDGKMDLAQFGGKIKEFGQKLKDYSDEVIDIDTGKVSSSITSAQKLVKLAQDIADMDKVDVGNFKVNKIGSSMNDYYESVKDIDAGLVSSSVKSAVKLSNLIVSLADIDSSGISKFDIKGIGSRLQKYGESVSGLNAGLVNASVKSAGRLASFINSLATINTTGVNRFKTAVNVLGTISVDEIAKAFNGSAVNKVVSSGTKLIDAISKGMKNRQPALISTANQSVNGVLKAITSRASAFAETSKKLMARFVAGIASQRGKVSSAVSSCVSSAVTKTRGYYSSFHSAGGYLADGFARGISANSYKAAAKARAMAEAAKQAAEKALGIASPSKVFYKIGDYTGQGFINALVGYAQKSYRAASDLGTSAKSGLNDAIGKAYDIISGKMETQPTIRPVLDLSGVEAGASKMNGLLNGVSNVGVMANMNAIGSMMEHRRQNGGNADVVSAIDKLRKGLGNVGGTTYNVNGVTYDDGSNIAGAVETIARAALRERRT